MFIVLFTFNFLLILHVLPVDCYFCLFYFYLASTTAKRFRAPGDILNPDNHSHKYLNKEVEGIVESSTAFMVWFNNAVESEHALPGTKFGIDKDSFTIEHWQSFRSKYCIINNAPCTTVISLIEAFAMHSLLPTR